MRRALLDVNVIASAAVSPVASPRAVFDAWRHHAAYELIISDPVLDRLTETLQLPYFRKRLSAYERGVFLHLLISEGTVVTPDPTVRHVAENLEDDLVLATAIAGAADYLVTGDKGLLRLDGYRGLILLTPADFRLVLEQPETAEAR